MQKISFTKLLQLNDKKLQIVCYTEIMKEKLIKIYEFLKKPNLFFTILCYVLFALFGSLAIVFACQNKTGFWMYFAYSGMAATFFYCVYLFARFDCKRLIKSFKNLKEKSMQKSKIINGYFSDYYTKTMIKTIFSLILGVCFVAYNLFVGLYYHSIWNTSIAIYYLLLVGIRVLYLVGEYKLNKNQELGKMEIEKKRAKMFVFGGVLMLLLSFTLTLPVTLLAMSKKQVVLPMWVAIADACYVFYKVTMCIIEFVKTRKNNVLSVKGIKNLNLTAVAVTLLSLENSMILTFSEGVDKSMMILTYLTAFAVMVISIVVAILTIVGGKKEFVNLKNSQKEEVCQEY